MTQEYFSDLLVDFNPEDFSLYVTEIVHELSQRHVILKRGDTVYFDHNDYTLIYNGKTLITCWNYINYGPVGGHPDQESIPKEFALFRPENSDLDLNSWDHTANNVGSYIPIDGTQVKWDRLWRQLNLDLEDDIMYRTGFSFAGKHHRIYVQIPRNLQHKNPLTLVQKMVYAKHDEETLLEEDNARIIHVTL